MALVDVEEQSTAGPSHSRSSSVLAATAAESVSSSRRESRRGSKDREVGDGGRGGDDHVCEFDPWMSICVSLTTTMRKAFKTAEEDIELQDSATAPLLAGAAASPRLLDSEERHLLEAEGHNSVSRGSILDAVTNVSIESSRSASEMLTNESRDMVDGQLHYRSWYSGVS